MPLNETMIDAAQEILSQVTLNSFSVSPDQIRPGVAATLQWRVSAPSAVQISLNGSTVSKAGSKSVQPTATTVYRLIAKVAGLQKTLGTVTLSVDQGQCIVHTVPEEAVRALLRSKIDAALAGGQLSQRSPAVVEIDRSGVAVKLRLKVDVPNFFDPDLDVDMVIAIAVVGNSVAVSFRNYSNDLDWPWWVTGITLGTSKVVEEIIESKIEQSVKPMLLATLKQHIDDGLKLIAGSFQIISLTTDADRITATVCPQ